MHDKILVLDFGSQYTQLIARRTRELGVYSEIKPFNTPVDEIKKAAPKAIIFSGGPASVWDEESPRIDLDIFNLNIPILGICYGMQITTHLLGGKVERSDKREFGPAKLKVIEHLDLLKDIPDGSDIWMSHGDRVLELPEGFTAIAESENSPVAAVKNEKLKMYCTQFHPEVVHTKYGKEILSNFIFNIAGCKNTWTSKSFADSTIKEIREKVGSSKVICGLSGGVDSAVAAVIIQRAIMENLYCIFVDTGLMRFNESAEVVHSFKDMGLNLIHVDATERFYNKLSGVSDPEKKRKIIGEEFINVFDEEASKISDVDFLAQGTLYPDVIESVSVKGPSATIKSHHNVGGLPEKMNLKLVEPLRELFKDEVRAVGYELGVPANILNRHPFPGPGLGIRIMGEITKERVEILRLADHIFIDEIKKGGIYDDIWQAFCVYLPVKTVGVMGDERTYEDVIALRAVTSLDGMTANWSRIPYDILEKTSVRIINEVKGINRVVYDISTKPPSTIEWE
ncbi:MAG: GMP synthase [glutamine-hydrolyzing] [Thermodesulfobacteriota bacterium]|nr:MAG: GMP synthase [glutamine-hydrolyzing] [Thermodesulfobacteriota bacterium]